MKLEQPIVKSTAALVMLMLEEDVSKSSAISETTEKRDVEENVTASAVKERQKTINDLRQSGSVKYGEGSVDVRVRFSSLIAKGFSVCVPDGIGVDVADELLLSKSYDANLLS